MKRIIRASLILASVVLFNTGCISMKQVQLGINNLDDAWRAENIITLKNAGTKTYKISKREAFNAMTIALSEMGLIVQNSSYEAGLIVLRGPAPAPLTKKEYLAITKGDEAKAKAVMTDAAGFLVGSSFNLGSFLSEVVINVHMLERKEDLQISLRMIIETPAAAHPGMKFGQQPPPSAVRAGLSKIWDAFERKLFEYNKTFS